MTQRDWGEDSALPEPARASDVVLSAVLAARRSTRQFADVGLDRGEVGQLLWAAQGLTGGDGLRSAPSAGASYPLTVHVAAAEGLYLYQPGGHRLVRTSRSDIRVPLGQAALRQEWVGRAPAVFAITADVPRTARRYGGRAERYVLLEAGHAAQNLLLQAVALGLGGVPVGAFDDDAVHRLLRLSRSHRPVYLLPVGRPATIPGAAGPVSRPSPP